MSHLKKFIALGMTVVTVAGLMPVTSLAAVSGWVEEDGKWYFYSSGRKEKYKTVYESGLQGYYLLNGRGERVTGKKGLYTTKYMMSAYGDKVKFKRSYYLNEDGSVLDQKWKKIDGKYYYFGYSGIMTKASSAEKIDKETGKLVYYLLGNDGARITKKGWHQVTYKGFEPVYGNIKSTKYWYYVKSDGTLQTGLKKIKGKYYLFNSSGCLIQNGACKLDNGKTYVADKNGERIKKKGWVSVKRKESGKHSSTTYSETITYWYYLKSDSTCVTGWKKLDGKWYYFSPYRSTACTVAMYNKETGKYDNYYFNSKGVCRNYK